MRSYELMVVLDPRINEDETAQLIQDIRELLENSGVDIIKVDEWGRRKLAYEIQDLKDGHYVLYYLGSEGGDHKLPEVKVRLQQHDSVLRYLVVRTDEDLRRAGRPLPHEEPPEEEGEEAEESPEGETDGDESSGEEE